MSRKRFGSIVAGLALVGSMGQAQAAFIVEADNVAPAGKANQNFAATPANGFSLSTTPSAAVGLAGNQSAFGNPANSTGPDRYTFSYTPGVDVDNTTFTIGTILGSSSGFPGEGNVATGAVGGITGPYRVYFTTPETTSVSGGGSDFTITQDGAPIVINDVNLNDGGTGPDTNPGTGFVGGANNAWWLLGTVNLTAGNTYTVSLEANNPTFVSQRAHGVMWEAVPEPGSLSLLAIAGATSLMRRRRA